MVQPASSTVPTLPFGPLQPGASDGLSTSQTDGNTSSGAQAQSEFLQRVVQGAHHTIDRLAETAAPHLQRLQEGMSTAGDTLTQESGHMREIGDGWAESLRTTVREHPMAALGTAVAVGLLISYVTRPSNPL